MSNKQQVKGYSIINKLSRSGRHHGTGFGIPIEEEFQSTQQLE